MIQSSWIHVEFHSLIRVRPRESRDMEILIPISNQFLAFAILTNFLFYFTIIINFLVQNLFEILVNQKLEIFKLILRFLQKIGKLDVVAIINS